MFELLLSSTLAAGWTAGGASSTCVGFAGFLSEVAEPGVEVSVEGRFEYTVERRRLVLACRSADLADRCFAIEIPSENSANFKPAALLGRTRLATSGESLTMYAATLLLAWMLDVCP